MERNYYLIEEAARLTGYSTSDLIHFGAQGQLELFALVPGSKATKTYLDYSREYVRRLEQLADEQEYEQEFGTKEDVNEWNYNAPRINEYIEHLTSELDFSPISQIVLTSPCLLPKSDAALIEANRDGFYDGHTTDEYKLKLDKPIPLLDLKLVILDRDVQSLIQHRSDLIQTSSEIGKSETEIFSKNFTDSASSNTTQKIQWRKAFSYKSLGLEAIYTLIEKYYFDENGPIYDIKRWAPKKQLESNYFYGRKLDEIDIVITSKQRKNTNRSNKSSFIPRQFHPSQLTNESNDKQMRKAFLFDSAGLNAMYDLIEKYFFDGDEPILEPTKWEKKSSIVSPYLHGRTKAEIDTAITDGKRTGKAAKQSVISKF